MALSANGYFWPGLAREGARLAWPSQGFNLRPREGSGLSGLAMSAKGSFWPGFVREGSCRPGLVSNGFCMAWLLREVSCLTWPSQKRDLPGQAFPVKETVRQTWKKSQKFSDWHFNTTKYSQTSASIERGTNCNKKVFLIYL